jgi:hypothetical protein
MRMRQDNRKAEREQTMAIAPWLIGYTLFLISLFAVCVAMVGLTTTLWGFALTHLGCALTAMALWWYDERRWGQAVWPEDVTEETPTPVLTTLSTAHQPTLMQQESEAAADWLSLKAEDFEMLESYTATLTERVSAVYPLVAREHVHKIVWTVMIELFCKRVIEATDTTPASVLTARISKAA